MHYKNGTEAREGDAIIGRLWTGKVFTGMLHSTNPSADACNGQVAQIIPGGVNHTCCSTADLYSAAEALNALEEVEKQPQPKAAVEPPQAVEPQKAEAQAPVATELPTHGTAQV